MEEKDLLEMPIEVINPGNGLPEAPPCVPFISVLPCRIEFDGGGGSVPCAPIFNPFPNSTIEVRDFSAMVGCQYLLLFQSAAD